MREINFHFDETSLVGIDQIKEQNPRIRWTEILIQDPYTGEVRIIEVPIHPDRRF